MYILLLTEMEVTVKIRITALLFILGIISYLSADQLLWQTDLPIRQGLNIEWFRTATASSDGGAVFVWSDTKLGGRDLWAQKVDAAGNMVWGATPKLIDNKPDRQEDPVVIATSDNNYIVAWIDFSSDLDGDVYAQKLDSNGNIVWQQGGVPVCVMPSNQISLNIVSDNAGGAFILWNDGRNPSTDIYGAHVNSAGVQTWTQNGIPLANSNGNETSNTMWEDGQGGFMLAYANNSNNNTDLYYDRFLAGGTSAWNGRKSLAVGPGDQISVKIAPDGTGSFILAWADKRNVNSDIYAQRINLAGDFLWAQDFVVCNDTTDQDNPRIQQTSDQGAIIVWEDKRLDSSDPDLYAQKITSTGTMQWTPNGLQVVAAPFAQRDPRLVSDGAGGCVVSWDDARNGNFPQIDVYTQHILANGTMAWDTNGKVLVNLPAEQMGSLVKASAGNYYYVWQDSRNGSIGLYYQVLNSSGSTLLEENGKQVYWGLSGDAIKSDYEVLKRSNDVVIVWQDTRAANFGYQIYFQIVNTDGTLEMPVNGASVTVPTGGKQINHKAVVLPNDQIAVVWEEQRGTRPKVYAQLLDVNGARLWGDTGLEITQNTPIKQMEPQISYVDGAIVLGWSALEEYEWTELYRVYAQKYVNGQPQWGTNGKLISETPVGQTPEECLLKGITGNYFYWINNNTLNIDVKYVDASGNAVTGWNVQGNPVSTIVSSKQNPSAVLDGNDLYITWEDSRELPKNLFAQKFTPTGQAVWNAEGVVVGDYGSEQSNASVLFDGGLYNVWSESIGGSQTDIAIQKMSTDGAPLWGNTGYFVIQRDSTQDYASMIKIRNDRYLVAWEDTYGIESDIYVRAITSGGQLLGPNTGFPVCTQIMKQYRPLMVPIDNERVFIVWADGRSSGKTEIIGLYAQMVSASYVPNSDEVGPIESAALMQNYPNPFNPNTMIRFQMPKSEKVKVEVFNIKGQKVRTLFDGIAQRGATSLNWDGTNDSKQSVSSGVYFYQMTTKGFTTTKKMVLMK